MTKDKRCAKPFAAEISTAFQNEKLAVQTEETVILQILARGNKYISKTLAWYMSHGKTEKKTRPSSSNVQLNEPLESVSGEIDVNGGFQNLHRKKGLQFHRHSTTFAKWSRLPQN